MSGALKIVYDASILLVFTKYEPKDERVEDERNV
jgi:hypothetical protein